MYHQLPDALAVLGTASTHNVHHIFDMCDKAICHTAAGLSADDGHPVPIYPDCCFSQRCCLLQVPDIYDSAKYDAIHNSELGLDIQELYKVGHTPSA